MRILITGGTAFIGAHLCRRLTADGHHVFALKRGQGNAETGDGPPPEFIAADLLDYSAIQAAVKSCEPEVVFHLASARSTAGGDNAALVLRTNGEATYNLLSACAGLTSRPKVIFTSAMGCYNYEKPEYLPVDEKHPLNPPDTYGLSKLMGELACQFFHSQAGLPCIILRISGVFGPGKRGGIIYNCLEASRNGGSIKVPGGRVTRDFVYVADVVESLILSMNTPIRNTCEIYNIGSGRGTSLPEIIQMVEDVTGRTIQVESLPNSQESEFYFDITKAERELGFRPHRLEERIADFWRSLTDAEA